MSAASPMIALPESLLQEAARHADSLGVSTEQWVEIALSERIRLEKETEEFFAPRITRSLSEILKNIGNNPPDPGDEL